MAKKYLVTGIAGSGKTTVKRALENAGYKTYDIDDGFAHWVDRTTHTIVPYDANRAPMTEWSDWSIDANKLRKIITGPDTIIMCGSAHDLYTYYDLFDDVFLLHYPSGVKDTIKQRVMTRTSNSNDYGKAPGEFEAILGYWKEYEQEYINRNVNILDCTLPLDVTTKEIEHAIRNN